MQQVLYAGADLPDARVGASFEAALDGVVWDVKNNGDGGQGVGLDG